MFSRHAELIGELAAGRYGAASGNVAVENRSDHHLSDLALQAAAAFGGEMKKLVAHGTGLMGSVELTLGSYGSLSLLFRSHGYNRGLQGSSMGPDAPEDPENQRQSVSSNPVPFAGRH